MRSHFHPEQLGKGPSDVASILEIPKSIRYDSEIAEADRRIGTLLKVLRQQRLENNTIVIVSADHGEEFGKHGGSQHGLKLYPDLSHVPLVIRVPGSRPTVIQTPVELADVVPTLCELLGLPTSWEDFDGQSLLAAIEGRRSADYMGAYSENHRHGEGIVRRALMTDRQHLIQDFEHSRIELHDTAPDPLDQDDVVLQHPDVWRPLRDGLAARGLRRAGQLFRAYQGSGDPEVLARGLHKLSQLELVRIALEKLSTAANRSQLRGYFEDLLVPPGLSPSLRRQTEALLRRDRQNVYQATAERKP